MITFKEYYKQHSELFFESPLRTGFNFDDPAVDNQMLNVENTKEHVLDLPVVGTYDIDKVSLACHREYFEGGSKFQDYWVSANSMTGLYFVFKHTDGGLTEGGVWQHRSFRGVARMLMFGFYLKNFEFVLSDRLHSTQGEKYWKSIINYATHNEHSVKVVSTLAGTVRDISEVDADSLWSRDPASSDVQIQIFAV